jgi:hypothetical protein
MTVVLKDQLEIKEVYLPISIIKYTLFKYFVKSCYVIKLVFLNTTLGIDGCGLLMKIGIRENDGAVRRRHFLFDFSKTLIVYSLAFFLLEHCLVCIIGKLIFTKKAINMNAVLLPIIDFYLEKWDNLNR